MLFGSGVGDVLSCGRVAFFIEPFLRWGYGRLRRAVACWPIGLSADLWQGCSRCRLIST